MSNRTFIFVISLIMVLFVSAIFLKTNTTNSPKVMSHDRIKYLRDSLEMEYIKKQLESYPYDHSEIKDTVNH